METFRQFPGMRETRAVEPHIRPPGQQWILEGDYGSGPHSPVSPLDLVATTYPGSAPPGRLCKTVLNVLCLNHGLMHGLIHCLNH